jgi:hypothetical protein
MAAMCDHMCASAYDSIVLHTPGAWSSNENNVLDDDSNCSDRVMVDDLTHEHRDDLECMTD